MAIDESSSLKAEIRALRTRVAELERTLRDTEERLTMMIDSVRDYAIFTLSADKRIATWNAGAQHVFGFTDEEAIGQSGEIIFTPEDRAAGALDQEIATAISMGYASDERWHMRLDGTRFFASGVMRPMIDADGNVRGLIKVVRDITQRKVVEEERAELLQRAEGARREAEQANMLKSRFLAIVSHELRGPLTSIRGFTTTLLAPDVEWGPEQQREFIGIIDSETQRLAELVNALLDAAQIQAGTLKINLAPILVGSVIQTALPQLLAISQEHNLELDIPDPLPPVLADPHRISQVLVNLVGNAAKFSPAGARIRVRARAIERAVQISVSDEGPGIPQAHQVSIFEPFQQLPGQSEHKSGAGLGLSISRGIIEAHHGHIWVEASDTSGTTISFTLLTADLPPVQ